MQAYRIVGWEETFAKAQMRKAKAIRWIAIPVDFDSNGYVELMAHRRGPQFYAVFLSMVKIAARSGAGGFLLKSCRTPVALTSHSCRTPVDALSISRRSLISYQTVRWALPELQRIGWIELIDIETGSPDTSVVGGAVGGTVVATRQDKTRQDSTPQPPTGGDNICEQIVAQFNAHRGGLPKVQKLTPARRKKVLARVNSPDLRDIGLKEPGDWGRLVRWVADDDFYGGRTTKWRADFDFLMRSDDVVLKICEKAYNKSEQEDSPDDGLVPHPYAPGSRVEPLVADMIRSEENGHDPA